MKNQFSFSSTAAEVAAVFPNEISNRVFVITGGYGGIGAQAAIALLEQNATVVVAGRSDKSIAAFRQEHAKYGDRLRGGLLDLGDLQSVTRFANTLLSEGKPIDVLINNAGLMATPEGRTAQGHETQFGTNVIGHFLLSKLLLPLLKKSSQGGRIVWLSSVGECVLGFWCACFVLKTHSSGHSIHGAARIDLDWLRRFKSGEQVKYDTWVRYQQSKVCGGCVLFCLCIVCVCFYMCACVCVFFFFEKFCSSEICFWGKRFIRSTASNRLLCIPVSLTPVSEGRRASFRKCHSCFAT